MQRNIDFPDFNWINEPGKFKIEIDRLTLVTDPNTDLWQKTYYRFQNDNAHLFVTQLNDQEFSFSVKTDFEPKTLYDQCGVVLYQDSNNWFKASLEYESEESSKLGSVVTNFGYSDWASTDIEGLVPSLYYRISRRGQEFLLEKSEGGKLFNQMRMFRMHQDIDVVTIGVYACSPLKSSIKATFSEISFGDCAWEAYDPESHEE